jgi:predicted nucleotidyltransferase
VSSDQRSGVTFPLDRAKVDQTIEEAARRLVAAAHPDKIILFGSYARGDFDGRSDLDLLVILPKVENRAAEMVRLRRVLKGIPMPIDILVYSVNEVEQRRDLRGTMLYHALQEGRILHDAA